MRLRVDVDDLGVRQQGGRSVERTGVERLARGLKGGFIQEPHARRDGGGLLAAHEGEVDVHGLGPFEPGRSAARELDFELLETGEAKFLAEPVDARDRGGRRMGEFLDRGAPDALTHGDDRVGQLLLRGREVLRLPHARLDIHGSPDVLPPTGRCRRTWSHYGGISKGCPRGRSL